MKTAEERHTAWLDGQLPSAEAAAYEAGLPDPDAAQAERAWIGRFGDDLRQHLVVPPLASPDFFTHGILTAIREPIATAPAETPPLGWFGRLAWLGTGAVALAVVLGFSMIPRGQGIPRVYNAEVLRTEVPSDVSPTVSAVAFHAEQSGLTVLWLDGLEYLPATHALN